MQTSAQGSITIQRLRTGDSLFITLDNLSGRPLYQGLETESGAITPDWSMEGNDALRPVIRPKVTSTLGATVSLSGATWAYNGRKLSFMDGASPEAWAYEDSPTPKFAFRQSDLAIKPIGNLLNRENIANGLLQFSAKAITGGGEFSIQKGIDVILTKAGQSVYYAFITASALTLTASNPISKLTATLYSSGAEVPDFYTKWYRDRDHIKAYDGKKTIVASREGVDSTQLYIGEFYLNESDAKAVAVAGVTVVDADDQYDVHLEITSANKYLDEAHPCLTVAAHLVAATTGKFQTEGVSWLMDVIDPQTFKSIKSSDTDSIEVTLGETDRERTIDGERRMIASDVTVLAEAHWRTSFDSIPDLTGYTPYYRDMDLRKGEAQAQL